MGKGEEWIPPIFSPAESVCFVPRECLWEFVDEAKGYGGEEEGGRRSM